MVKKNNPEPPKRSGGDIAHTIVKAGLSAIPVVGGSAAEVFNAVIVPPVVKRRDEWMRSVTEGLEKLEETFDGFKIDSLRDNDAFVTAVVQATSSAIRNHQQEKLDALRNAVLNIAMRNAPDEDLQLIFLNFIDTLTSWHLRILRFFQDPPGYGKANGVNYRSWHMGGPSTVLEYTFRELSGRSEFYDQIVGDLYTRGLMTSDTSALHTTMTSSGMFAKRTTPMGDNFLAFIASPVSD